jgi:DnaK suppressor protein
MSGIDDSLLRTFAQLLEQRALQLRTEVAAGARSVRAPEGMHDKPDFEEEADNWARSHVGDAELDRDLAELEQVEAARRRIDEGRYGLCADCGDAIDVQRLHAEPAALRCLACQGRFEHAHPAAPGS